VSTVITEVGEGIGRLTLNRPEAMNAVTTELAAELERALAALAEEARVIVIRGAGGNFCVGGDFKALEPILGDAAALRELFEAFHGACSLIAELPVPVIAAVEGNAMAGGFELMQACDFALVRDDARIADNHSNFGQIPGGGGSQRLPRLVGRQRALGLLLTGEKISGAQAAEWGLAYRAFPAAGFEAGVGEIAAGLAAKSPAALAGIKALVREGGEQSLDDALALEVDRVVDHIAGAGVGELTNRAGGR
jgi:enoyl-CoA hydratase/carnithine racemase